MPLVFFFLIFMSPSFLQPLSKPGDYLIFWNIRQGQWLTLVEPNICHHFDIGGDRAPFTKIRRICSSRQNTLWLTHFDKSHLKNLKRLGLNICIAYHSNDNSSFLNKIPVCPQISKRIQAVRINSKETVFLISQKFLITGDTPQALLPNLNFTIGLAPQGGNTQYIKHKDGKLWLCQPQHRTKRHLLGCLSTAVFGNIAWRF